METYGAQCLRHLKLAHDFYGARGSVLAIAFGYDKMTGFSLNFRNAVYQKRDIEAKRVYRNMPTCTQIELKGVAYGTGSFPFLETLHDCAQLCGLGSNRVIMCGQKYRMLHSIGSFLSSLSRHGLFENGVRCIFIVITYFLTAQFFFPLICFQLLHYLLISPTGKFYLPILLFKNCFANLHASTFGVRNHGSLYISIFNF